MEDDIKRFPRPGTDDRRRLPLVRALARSSFAAAVALAVLAAALSTSVVTGADFRTSGSAEVVSAIDARPNDGSGYWPDFSNTGYANTPANAGGLGLGAYPGKLTDYTSGMSADKPLTLRFPDNSVISYKRFLSLKVLIYGDNLTFVGCLFEGTNPNDNLVQIYSDNNIKFLYSTFKPSSYAMPPGNDGTVSSSHTKPGTPFDKSWQLATTMKEAVAVMDHNDIWGNAGMIMVTGFPGRPSTWTNNYIHDMADTSHDVYHHDGIGPQSEGNGGPMIVDHNTLASVGNTNALALQGDGVYDHISFTNNYVSGWGYAVSIGVKNNATNITVTDNVFSTELEQLYGFLYGNIWGGSTRGSTWRRNLIQARTGDDNTAYSTADNGKYLWPSGAAHATDYTG
ncbi:MULTISPECIES: hypothetical protein [unclassified Nonomuraea]|uniref:hypothetical protein n=1 Tax=unclassified Nonomuraea TaxID=2593643 RepID=UPI0033D3EB73